MTAAKTPKPIAKAEVKKSRWAQMRDEARAAAEEKRAAIAPYEFDGTEPATLVYPPDSVEQVTALARLLDSKLGMRDGEIRDLFEALLGKSFGPIWDVIKDEPATVLWPLFDDINNHFQAVPADEVDAQGGANGS